MSRKENLEPQSYVLCNFTSILEMRHLRRWNGPMTDSEESRNRRFLVVTGMPFPWLPVYRPWQGTGEMQPWGKWEEDKGPTGSVFLATAWEPITTSVVLSLAQHSCASVYCYFSQQSRHHSFSGNGSLLRLQPGRKSAPIGTSSNAAAKGRFH